MTQKELAAKLGIKEQMVQRYEASGYESIGFGRLAEVWNALSASILMMTVSLNLIDQGECLILDFQEIFDLACQVWLCKHQTFLLN
jgi:transcriptional regulator with XRE-family HTH domain